MAAQKELQKMNMYKAPRDKLMCILSCCKVINNLLLNASIASKENAPGADEFLPVLIYVTIKANPPQFHSNLLYIQRYRRQSKLVGEAAYFFTNLLSAESFISNIDAKSLSMDEADFEMKMESARARLSGLGSQTYQTDQGAAPLPRDEPKGQNTLLQSQSSDSLSGTNETLNQRSELQIKKAESVSDLENKGAATLLKDNSEASKIFKEYPYMFASAGDLRVGNVEELLNDYKQLVFKYVCLSKGLGEPATSLASSNSPLQPSAETEDRTTTLSSEVQAKTETDMSVDDLMRALQGEGDNVHKLSDVKQEVSREDVVEERAEELDPKVGEETDNEDTDLKKQSVVKEGENSSSQQAEDEEADSKQLVAEDQNDPSR
ncbi:VPS9 domain-containing protein [Hirschfeldia incana]|nr:VPS9 domain-containing protein [Hirschfeldia incana]